jgi:hypothetical protein
MEKMGRCKPAILLLEDDGLRSKRHVLPLLLHGGSTWSQSTRPERVRLGLEVQVMERAKWAQDWIIVQIQNVDVQ